MKGWIRTDVLAIAAIILMVRSSEGAKVTTTHGEIEGLTETIEGVTVDIYLGVPFAMPPTGELRFRAPQPIPPWSGVKQTTKQPNCCIQTKDTYIEGFSGVEMWNPNTNISEDCLYLNIWVPRNNDSMKTTMVWIYGGSFVYGSNTLDVYDGRYLAAKQGVIVASMQYRMGVLGFLYANSQEAPGNMGLLDQQAAFKWLHDNIERFGGNRDKLTLIGESAGSASVSHHLLAPTSWPYFNNAIMLSSTSLAPWAIEPPENLLRHLRSLANITNCHYNEMDKIVQCLRKTDALYLEDKQWYLNNKNIGTFSPTVDGNFMPDFPEKLLSSGNVKKTDILLGNTKDEGEFFILYFYKNFIPPESIWNTVSLNRTQFLQIVNSIGGCHTNDELCRAGMLFTYEFSNLPSLRSSHLDMIDDMLGDSYFKCSVRDFALHYARLAQGRTYVYSFDYRHSATPWPSWMGVLHAYEIEIVFGLPFNKNLNYSDLDREVSTKVMNYFTTFAKRGGLASFGNEWPEFSNSSEEHIVFSQNGSASVRRGFRTKECTFWSYLMPSLKQYGSSGGSLTDSTLVVERLCTNGSPTSDAIRHSVLVMFVCFSVILSALSIT